MSKPQARWEMDEAELGPLRFRTVGISSKDVCRNTGAEGEYTFLFTGIPLLAIFAALLGGGLAWLVGAPMPIQKSILGLVIVGMTVCAAIAFHLWWGFLLPFKSYLAIHERGIAYRCFLSSGRVRFSEMTGIFIGTAQRMLEQAVLKSNPMALNALNEGTLRMELVGGKSCEIRHLLHHMTKEDKVAALQTLAAIQPVLFKIQA